MYVHKLDLNEKNILLDSKLLKEVSALYLSMNGRAFGFVIYNFNCFNILNCCKS